MLKWSLGQEGQLRKGLHIQLGQLKMGSKGLGERIEDDRIEDKEKGL